MFQITRKSDRQALATRITELAEAHGAVVVRRVDDRSISLDIRLNGAYASLWLDGDRRMQDCVIVNWGVGCSAERQFSHNFGCAARTHRNDHKAHFHARDAEDLCDSIDGGFGVIRLGSAFEALRVAA